MIRIDDFPTGIRPIQDDNFIIYKKILDCFEKEKLTIHLGCVPDLLDDRALFLKDYKNIIPCQHGSDHCYPFYSQELIKANDIYNSKTFGIFDEFKNQNVSQIKEKLQNSKKKLEEFFGKEIDTFIPVCNVINSYTAIVLKDMRFKTILSESQVFRLNVIKSDFYGRMRDINYYDECRIFTFHLTWEVDVINESGFDRWYEYFMDFVNYYKNIDIPKLKIEPPLNPYNILFKFPTRGRVDKFFEVLDLYYEYIHNRDCFKFLITIDEDDDSMNNWLVLNTLAEYENLSVVLSNSKSKIEAINASIPDNDWDIIFLVSDDMIPQVKGFDNIIREKMIETFPDTDGVLWFNDGYQGRHINTLSILGYKYYKRFGYLYQQDYKSIRCDKEFTVIADRLRRQKYFEQVIVKHEHPTWLKEEFDELYAKNKTYENEDEILYQRRLKLGFPIGIPKIAYFFWNNETPLSYLRYLTLETFRKLHSNWQMILYIGNSNTEKQWIDIPKQDFNEYKGENWIDRVCDLNVVIREYKNELNLNPNYVSDIFRYDILYRNGGWYFDLDQLFLRNFDEFCSDYEFVYGGKNITYNGVLGASPLNRICEAVINRQTILLKKKVDKYCQLGNWCLTEVKQKNPSLFISNKILETEDEVFYPILESHNSKYLYNGVIDIEEMQSHALHLFGGHPDTQEFNSKFNKEFMETSDDSISKFLRKNK